LAQSGLELAENSWNKNILLAKILINGYIIFFYKIPIRTDYGWNERGDKVEGD